MSKKAEGFSLRFVLINTGNISRKVLSKVLRSFDKNFERLQDACVGYISKIENNRVNNISLSLACELASVLNVSLGYLVGESTENEMMDEEMLRKYGACTADEKRKLLKIVDILRDED